MPTDRTPAPWAHLAETVIARLRSAIAEDGWFAATDLTHPATDHDASSPGSFSSRMTRAAARLDPPMHLPDEQIDAIRRAGGDPHRTDAGGRDRPGVHIPTDELLLAIRLAATFGSTDRRDAMLTEGATTLIGTDRPIEATVLRRLIQALLPEDWRIRSGDDGGGDRILVVQSVPGAEENWGALHRSLKEVTDAISDRAPLLCVTADPATLPDGLRHGADLLPLARLDQEIVLATLRASHSATGAIDAGPVRAALPSDEMLSGIDETALLLAFRASGPVEVACRLARAVRPHPGAGPTLVDVAGTGPAEAQARRMVRDLQAWRAGRVAWSDVERSVIFHGAPGCGKSYLARAMSGEAGVALVRGNFAAWQATGHLGDMLRAMRDSFAEARRSAPCVFVIDEIDAVGSRSGGDRHGSRYHRQVVNGFLQELDALAQMEGVLVVGTCNDPHAIDPAVRRPGRFDAHVRVPVPGRATVVRMLETAFPDSDEAVLAPAIRAATGLTAAAIDAAIRAARAAARDEGETATPRHLLDELADRVCPRDIAYRIAVHEAGHAMVAHALDLGGIERIALTPGGGEIELKRHQVHGLLSDHEAHLVYDLAGRAAEIAILGTPSAGAGGSEGSDLAKATACARHIELNSGLGLSGLGWNCTVDDLDAAIRERLTTAETRAMEIVTARKACVLRIADRLLESGVLERDEIESAMRSPQEVGATEHRCPEVTRPMEAFS
ncbi:MAG: AAA family ATPase [Shimia sp.]